MEINNKDKEFYLPAGRLSIVDGVFMTEDRYKYYVKKERSYSNMEQSLKNCYKNKLNFDCVEPDTSRQYLDFVIPASSFLVGLVLGIYLVK